MAHYLRLGPDDNVVTIATDGFDRYPSVLKDMENRYLELEPFVLKRWARDIFFKVNEEHIYDFRKMENKERLFQQKEHDWLPFGYTQEYLDSMRSPEFWEAEYAKVEHYDRRIEEMR